MKVLFTGDRNFRSEYSKALREVFLQLGDRDDVEIIVGDCPTGVDALVRQMTPVDRLTRVKAEWDKYGRGAGMIRNKVMVDMKPDICIAVHSDYPNSKGTKDCASQAIKAGITTVLIPRNAPFNLKDYEL